MVLEDVLDEGALVFGTYITVALLAQVIAKRQKVLTDKNPTKHRNHTQYPKGLTARMSFG